MKSTTILILFLGASLSVTVIAANCNRKWNLEYETGTTLYIDFITALEEYTFLICGGGIIVNPTGDLDKEIWENRFRLYENYKDRIAECQCQAKITQFFACMGAVRTEMTTDVNVLIQDILDRKNAILDSLCT